MKEDREQDCIKNELKYLQDFLIQQIFTKQLLYSKLYASYEEGGREEGKCRVSATQDLTVGKHLYKQIDDYAQCHPVVEAHTSRNGKRKEGRSTLLSQWPGISVHPALHRKPCEARTLFPSSLLLHRSARSWHIGVTEQMIIEKMPSGKESQGSLEQRGSNCLEHIGLDCSQYSPRERGVRFQNREIIESIQMCMGGRKPISLLKFPLYLPVHLSASPKQFRLHLESLKPIIFLKNQSSEAEEL